MSLPDSLGRAVLPQLREKLGRGEQVCIEPGGVSMLPTFRPDRDLVILSPVPETLKKYDVPFYQRASGQLVLHRIIKTGKTYTCIGDNQFEKETGVTKAQMIGVVTGFIRDGRTYSVEGLCYKLYCRIWHHTRGLRYVYRRSRRCLGRLLRWLKLKS